MTVAETVLDLLERRRRAERDRRAAAFDLEFKRAPGVGADDALHVGEAVDRAAVDRDHDVAGLEAGRGGRGLPACTVSTRGGDDCRP